MSNFILICLLFVFASKSALAVEGAELSGSIGLSGALKSLVIKDKLPIGSLTSAVGYEVLDYKKQKKNKALYCVGSVVMSANTKILGFSFGGNSSAISTFDSCIRPEDYAGGFLKFGLSYGGSKGSKSISVEAAINIGFDLQLFNDLLERRLRIDYFGNHTGYRNRLSKIVKMLNRYLARKKVASAELALLKLVSYIIAPSVSFENLSIFTLEDEKNLKASKKSLKQNFMEMRYNIFRDTELYKCSEFEEYEECVLVAADLMIFMEIVEQSLVDCHSYSFTVSPQTDFSLGIFKNNNFSVNVGFSFYHLEKQFQSSISNAVLVNKYFWGHNFNPRSKECLEVSDMAGAQMGKFLGLIKN